MAFYKGRNTLQTINSYKFICDWRSVLPFCCIHKGDNFHRRIKAVVCIIRILYFVDRASLYNPVNKNNLLYNLFVVYLEISICFGRLWAHHQEKQLCFATLGTCYSVWMTVWYAEAYASVYQTVIHTEQQVPSVAKIQLFLLMMGT